MISQLLSIIIGTMATMIIGGIWYSFLFRDRYQREANIQLKDPPMEKHALLFELLGRFLQSTLMTLFYDTLKPINERSFALGLSLAVFFAVGFQIQYYTSKVVWEQKTWNYFFMKVSEQFISLTTLSLIAYLIVI